MSDSQPGPRLQYDRARKWPHSERDPTHSEWAQAYDAIVAELADWKKRSQTFEDRWNKALSEADEPFTRAMHANMDLIAAEARIDKLEVAHDILDDIASYPMNLTLPESMRARIIAYFSGQPDPRITPQANRSGESK